MYIYIDIDIEIYICICINKYQKKGRGAKFQGNLALEHTYFHLNFEHLCPALWFLEMKSQNPATLLRGMAGDLSLHPIVLESGCALKEEECGSALASPCVLTPGVLSRAGHGGTKCLLPLLLARVLEEDSPVPIPHLHLQHQAREGASTQQLMLLLAPGCLQYFYFLREVCNSIG